jgi:hypothetical protein
MNEIALDRSLSRREFKTRLFGTSDSRRSSAFYGYSLTVMAIGIGWLVRDRGIVNPGEGLGYWLGIVGGSMMLLLLLYPLRKRIKIFHFLGATTHWFRVHMILGIVGPLLVLYHCNFQMGSFNSQVALLCMLLVAGSGVVGRHIYARIHRGLYGQKTTLAELRSDLTESMKQGQGLATLMPDFAAKLDALSAEVRGDAMTGALGTRASLVWTFKKYVVRLKLMSVARRELQERSAESPVVAQDFERLEQASSTYIRNFTRLTGQVAQFTLYERLFSLWHVLHLPLFYMMIISALLHVLAVHMY